MATAKQRMPHAQDGQPARTTAAVSLVDPAMAKDWLDHYIYDRQRQVRPTHVTYLANLMRQGRFRAGSSIDFGFYDQQHYLVNGQHTLHAIMAYGQPIPLLVTRHIVASREELAHLYSTFDRQLRRTQQDVFHVFDFLRQSSLSKKQQMALAAGVIYPMTGFMVWRGKTRPQVNALAMDPETRLHWMAAWLAEAQQFFALHTDMDKLRKTCLERGAVVGVALATFRYCAERATTFWRAVARDEGLQAGDPARTLLRFLYNTPVQNQREAYDRYVAAAWNAFYEGRGLDKLYARPVNLPILLAGTPHNGRRAYWYLGPDLLPVPTPVLAEEVS